MQRPLALFLGLSAALTLAQAQAYKVSASIPLGGVGGWDYSTVDSADHRLYVSHGEEVVVVDTASEKPVGKVAGMKRIHGIALNKAGNLGYISDGGSNEVVFFDLKTLEVKQKVKTGANPDGILFDPASHKVFAFNGGSKNATVIDAATGHVDSTIPLGGKPEFPVSDGKGSVFVNVEDTNEIVRIDSKTLAVTARWSVKPCESPSGLAFDAANRRLFAVCDEKIMVVVDADSGKVVATPAIGEGPDAVAYDPSLKTVFSSNGEGTLTVVHQDGPNKYSVSETVKTARGARTMALDSATHKIYLASAEFGPAPAATAANPRPRPTMVPGTFKVLVVSK